ncbi:MAG: ROK family protein [Chitinophagaceae bacterium]|nr:ROK family protein [Chitinophagaceae bacterium]
MLLGFDIGGTKCAVTLGKEKNTKELNILGKERMLTRGTPEQMIGKMFSAADRLLTANHLTCQNISGIGISCGGPLSSKTGTILSPPNLPGWDNIPIVEAGFKKFGIRPVLQNDANACAVAEWKYGAGKGYDNIIFLTFGTGMGAGLILNGQLYSGTTDLAGEVGHLRLAEMGPVGFGKAGSFEGFCSGGGIAQLAQIKVREQLQMGHPVSFCKNLDELPGLTAKTVADAANNGDELAKEIYRICGFYLGRGLSLLIDILNPQVIILGSIFERSGALLHSTMHEVIGKEALKDAYTDCKILPAALGESIGDYAALSLATM